MAKSKKPRKSHNVRKTTGGIWAVNNVLAKRQKPEAEVAQMAMIRSSIAFNRIKSSPNVAEEDWVDVVCAIDTALILARKAKNSAPHVAALVEASEAMLRCKDRARKSLEMSGKATYRLTGYEIAAVGHGLDLHDLIIAEFTVGEQIAAYDELRVRIHSEARYADLEVA